MCLHIKKLIHVVIVLILYYKPIVQVIIIINAIESILYEYK